MTIRLEGQELVEAIGLLLENKKLVDWSKQDASVKLKALRMACSNADFWAEITVTEKGGT